MNDTCVIITGLLNNEFISPLIEMYKDVPNKIISTWKEQPQSLIAQFSDGKQPITDTLRDNGFIIKLNDYPSHRNCTNYQTVNIREGCILAKNLGFKYVIRMRTDLVCNDMIKFMGCINQLYRERITVLGFINLTSFYIIDFFIAGNINEMILVFNKEQKEDDKRFVEQYWMEEYLGKNDLNYFDLKQKLHTCLDILHSNNIDMEIISKNWGKIISNYCKKDFILN